MVGMGFRSFSSHGNWVLEVLITMVTMGLKVSETMVVMNFKISVTMVTWF